jgi:transposase, IS30 family
MRIRFSNRLVAELHQPFWAAWQAGEFLTDASALAGTHRSVGAGGDRAGSSVG